MNTLGLVQDSASSVVLISNTYFAHEPNVRPATRRLPRCQHVRQARLPFPEKRASKQEGATRRRREGAVYNLCVVNCCRARRRTLEENG